MEDPLKEGMAAHSNILAWGIPWTEEPGGLQSTGSQRDTTEVTEHTNMHTRLDTFLQGRDRDLASKPKTISKCFKTVQTMQYYFCIR